MKRIIFAISIGLFAVNNIKAQDQNVLVGLDDPAYGVRIKTNWPGSTTGWARGYYIVNHNNTANFFGLGAMGESVNGVSSLSYGWIGTDYDNPIMTFKPNGTIGNGNVGIGTISPLLKMDIKGTYGLPATNGTIQNGSLRLSQPSGTLVMDMGLGNTSGWIQATNSGNLGGTFPLLLNPNGGNIGIGTATPNEKLEVFGEKPGIRLAYANTYGFNMEVRHPAGDAFWDLSYYTNTGLYKNIISANYNGNVGIGTTTPTDLLSVKGTIRAMEVKVDLCENLADYVFSPTYKLRPLHEVEQFVKTNSHLPEIPSAAEVKEKGLNMGEMQNKLLQKVEELTLYVIDLKKTVDLQQAKIKELEQKK